MTTIAPRDPVTADRISNGFAEEPVAHQGRGLALRMWRPTSTSVVVHVAGELDASSAPRLHELLAPRLSSAAETVVLDFSGLRFMGVVGLELLAHARQRATYRGLTVCIVDGPVCVHRALHAAGWSETIPTYYTVAEAVAELPGRTRARPERVVR